MDLTGLGKNVIVPYLELSILMLYRRRERKTGAHGGPSPRGSWARQDAPLEISSRGGPPAPPRFDHSRWSESQLTKPGCGSATQVSKPAGGS